jgi:hypothetical protein
VSRLEAARRLADARAHLRAAEDAYNADPDFERWVTFDVAREAYGAATREHDSALTEAEEAAELVA